jgi:hypothetical protein
VKEKELNKCHENKIVAKITHDRFILCMRNFRYLLAVLITVDTNTLAANLAAA